MRCPNCNRETDELIENRYCPVCYEELEDVSNPYGSFYDTWGDDSDGS